jgi:phosphate transport system protein
MDVVNDSVDAYLRRDPAKAEATRQKDDLVDALNDQVVKELLTDQVLKNIIAGVEDLADQIAHVLLARHLERIADQATNICKEVIYMVRGDYVRHRRIQPPDAP